MPLNARRVRALINGAPPFEATKGTIVSCEVYIVYDTKENI